MAAGNLAIFVATPKAPQARISVANTARDGTGTLGTVYTAGANGSFFKGLRIQPEVAINAGDVVRVYNQVGGSGNNELIGEFWVDQQNMSSSSAGSPPIPPLKPVEWWPSAGIVMGAGDVLKASTDQGKQYNVCLLGGGDY